ncbi:hypothetical protein IC235_11960 [Hymenobacter sp. BT664]|uniref:Uncharacterized protein n=2 Tax=Hymenobacter montanus TaxID=2771359 RepID=A0A927BEK5_9BACT|nr:hypothetical protein [Hymenobacter montanus]
MHLSVYSRYVHIYWIPLFPFSKPTFVHCGHCQQAWEENGMPAELRSSTQQLKGQTRAPLWHWMGLLVIASLLAWSIISSGLKSMP